MKLNEWMKIIYSSYNKYTLYNINTIWNCMMGVPRLESELILKYNTYLLTNKSLSPDYIIKINTMTW